MERPFAYLGFSCLLGLLVAFFLSKTVLLCISIALFIILITLFLLKIKNVYIKLSIVGILFACVALFAVDSLYVVEDYQEEIVDIEGTLGEIASVGTYGTTYAINIEKINGETTDKILASLYSTVDLIYEYGDKFTGVVYISTIQNENGFTYNNYLLADYYKYSCELITYYDYDVEEVENKSLYAKIIILKYKVKDIIQSEFTGETSDLLVAMLLGDKTELSDELYTMFINCGVNHILVVSGMHLSILCGFFYLIMGKFRVPKIYVYTIIFPMIIAYVIFTGMGKSVIRSAIMMFVVIVSNIIGEENDGLNSLGLATFFICLAYPYSVCDTGFLLSVLATAGILMFGEKLCDKLQEKIPEKLKRVTYAVSLTFAISISAWVFVAPLTLYLYATINPLSIICTPILTLPVLWFMIFGILTIIFSQISILTPMAILPSLITKLSGKCIVFICEKFSLIGENIWKFREGMQIILVVALLLILIFYIMFKPNKAVKITSLLVTVVMLISAYTISIFDANSQVRLVVADTGYANFIMLVKGREAVVVSADGYSESTMNDLMSEYQINNINSLFVDDENSTLATAIEKSYNVENYIVLEKESDWIEIYDNVEMKYSLYGELIELNINGKTVLIDRGYEYSTVYECDLGISEQSKSMIYADLMIVNMEEYEDAVYEKTLRIREQSVVIKFDDEITIRSIE